MYTDEELLVNTISDTTDNTEAKDYEILIVLDDKDEVKSQCLKWKEEKAYNDKVLDHSDKAIRICLICCIAFLYIAVMFGCFILDGNLSFVLFLGIIDGIILLIIVSHYENVKLYDVGHIEIDNYTFLFEVADDIENIFSFSLNIHSRIASIAYFSRKDESEELKFQNIDCNEIYYYKDSVIKLIGKMRDDKSTYDIDVWLPIKFYKNDEGQ